MSEEPDDLPPELRSLNEKARKDAAPPGSTPSDGASKIGDGETKTVEELEEEFARERKNAEAERNRADVYQTRASEMEEQSRKNASALAQAQGEIAQKDDIIVGMQRGATTSWDGAVNLTTLAYGVKRDLAGALGFLKGPSRNFWPYIIFGAGVLIAAVVLVEVPYISQSPVDMALVALVVVFFALLAYWQTRRGP